MLTKVGTQQKNSKHLLKLGPGWNCSYVKFGQSHIIVGLVGGQGRLLHQAAHGAYNIFTATNRVCYRAKNHLIIAVVVVIAVFVFVVIVWPIPAPSSVLLKNCQQSLPIARDSSAADAVAPSSYRVSTKAASYCDLLLIDLVSDSVPASQTEECFVVAEERKRWGGKQVFRALMVVLQVLALQKARTLSQVVSALAQVAGSPVLVAILTETATIAVPHWRT